MYLHVGNHKNIRERDIIGIFDTDMSTLSPITRKFLSAAQKRGAVTSAKDEIPKSFVLYRENGEIKVCFSQISTSALASRKEY
ncbi:MAG: DUF370 domain-containing protein [Ruminococcaceae bacterium]|nr:DUF370 domain-containing protein [Oscillospiraceae bacterium]